MNERDIIKEMVIAINQIRDPDKKCSQLYNLHFILLHTIPETIDELIIDPIEPLEIETIKPVKQFDISEVKPIDLSNGKDIRDRLRART